jgi:hypothetical protein
MLDHDFRPVAGHPDDDECTHRSDGTDATYCGLTSAQHADWDDYGYTDADIEAEQEVDHILRARPGNLRFMPLAQRSDT